MILKLTTAFLISILIAAIAYWRGSLSRSGVLGALIVGTIIFGLGGWVWGLMLGVFFVSSSLLSHFREDDKRLAAEKFEKGHQRDMGQVLANGGLGSILAVMSYLFPSPIWFTLYMGIMATVTADTWATELGTLANKPPRLITNGRQVEVGTSGGVSALGTSVSYVGGFLIGLTAGLLDSAINLPMAAVIAGIAGLIGSLLDSFLGATVQQLYYCEVCHKDTERRVHKCGHKTRPHRGWSWLNNDLVNLLSSVVGGLFALGLWFVLT